MWSLINKYFYFFKKPFNYNSFFCFFFEMTDSFVNKIWWTTSILYFSLILRISLSKFYAVRFALRSSPIVTLRLCLIGILEFQCTGNLFGLLKTCVNVDPFSLISSVSKSFDGTPSESVSFLTHFKVMFHFYTTWKKNRKTRKFSDNFRGYRNEILTQNGLMCDPLPLDWAFRQAFKKYKSS